MADINRRLEKNVPGKFYVDEECIDCHICRGNAPDNFSRDEVTGLSYLSKQPENEIEFQLCMDSLDAYPVEAIGSDGSK